MVEIERNPLAVRQGAATIMCLAAAAVAMPVISYRAAEQRDGAEWAVTSNAFQADFDQTVLAEPNARIELTSLRVEDGLRARGGGMLFESADARAMMVQAVLRGPLEQQRQALPQPPATSEAPIDARQHRCLAQAVYYEARGETQRGQVAVAEVIMNRVRSRAYPNSVCGVVYQGSERSTGCQFTFTCDGSLNHTPRGRAWDRAQRVATAVMQGYTRPVTNHATHYHTTGVNPVWNSGLVQTTQIGVHVFYRMPNRAERPIYQAALARRRSTLPSRGVRDVTPDDVAIPEAEELVLSPEEQPMATDPVPADAAIETEVPADTSADASDVAGGEIAT